MIVKLASLRSPSRNPQVAEPCAEREGRIPWKMNSTRVANRPVPPGQLLACGQPQAIWQQALCGSVSKIIVRYLDRLCRRLRRQAEGQEESLGVEE